MIYKSYFLLYLILNPFTFLETSKCSINTQDSQTEPRKTKNLERLEQNICANTWDRTEAIFNLFTNNILDLKESNNDKPSLPITKPQGKLGYDEACKGAVYDSETKSTYSPSSHLQVLGTQSKPSTSIKSDTTVGFCGRPPIIIASLIEKDKLD